MSELGFVYFLDSTTAKNGASVYLMSHWTSLCSIELTSKACPSDGPLPAFIWLTAREKRC
jgi:hypothetical protein